MRLKAGEDAIKHVRKHRNSFAARSRYVQTLVVVDSVVRGWGEAFAYGNAPQTLKDLDKKIDEHLEGFRSWYRKQTRSMTAEDKRRTGGVGLLQDISPKLLANAPIVLPPPARFRRTKSTLVISTDGSTVGKLDKHSGTRAMGAWATINHQTGEAKTGWEAQSTNNRMELKAVIEALRQVEPNHAIVVRTDSRYVADAASKGHVIKNNFDLWQEFSELEKCRNVRVDWLRGHAGDEHNEMADKLARSTAEAGLRQR